jgi:hypothetical protein
MHDKDGAAPLAHQFLSDRPFHIKFNGLLTNHIKYAVATTCCGVGLRAPAEFMQRYRDLCELHHWRVLVSNTDPPQKIAPKVLLKALKIPIL